MSFFDMFKTTGEAVAPQQQTAPNQTAAQPPANVATASGMGGAAPEGKMAGTEQTPVNPLDVYAKLFEDAAKGTPSAPPALKISPDVLNNVSTNLDVTSDIDPALMQKATSGDAQAMLIVMQQVGRNSYKAAMAHNTALTDTFLNQRQTFDNTRVAAGVRQQLTQSALSAAPNYNHPVVRQELNRVAAQFARANPDTPPAEVAKAAQDYITQLSAALNPTTQPAPNANGVMPGEMDWAAYLSQS